MPNPPISNAGALRLRGTSPSLAAAGVVLVRRFVSPTASVALLCEARSAMACELDLGSGQSALLKSPRSQSAHIEPEVEVRYPSSPPAPRL
jgi:hypothetical protein